MSTLRQSILSIEPWRWAVAFLLAGLTVLLFAHPAFAQASVEASGNFSCTSNGGTSGTLYDSGSQCPTTLRFNNVFSFLVCNMEHLSSNLLGAMFCGVTTNLAPAVTAMVTLAVVIFGTGFTIGVIPATARDFQSFLLKVACIWMFATQSDLLIRYGYEFLVNGIRDGVAMAFNGYQGGGATSASTVYTQLDEFLGRFIKIATDYIGQSTNGGTAADQCKNALFAVMAVMAIAFPPIFFLAVLLLMKVAITFVRAVFGYMYALIGITFMLTLAPIFLSLYLFRQTRSFCEKWMGYMVSFALQIVMLFACMVFVLLLVDRAKSSAESFTDIVVKATQAPETTSFRMPWEYCTLCDFKVINKDTNAEIPKEKFDEFLGQGKLVCKDTPGKPIYALDTLTPTSSTQMTQTNSGQLGTLMRFVGGSLIALMVLAYIAEALLSSVPGLAQMLGGGFGGAYYAPQLGGGWNPQGRAAVDMPGGGLYNDFEAGMTRGFTHARNSKGELVETNNSVQGFARGFKEGMAQMITGRGGQADGSGVEHSGMKNRFLDWLTNPTGMDGH